MKINQQQFFQKNKRKCGIFALSLLVFLGLFLFIQQDYFLYQDPIVHVTAVSERTSLRDNADIPHHVQQITGEVKNGTDKGCSVAFENEYTESSLKGFPLKEGDDVFVTLSGEAQVRSILTLKRDGDLFILFAIFCFLLFIVSSKKSFLILLSTFINLVIFLLIIYLQNSIHHIFVLFSVATLCFTVVSLVLTCGRSRKTANAIGTTLISVAVMMTIAVIVFRCFAESFHYETVEFLTYVYDYKEVFYAGVLVSGLGAIMDTAIIMATSINELRIKDPEISRENLVESAREIAQDITGTIMNVLLFSCVVGALPSIVLIVSNGMPVLFAFEYFGSVEIIRALVGSIGIILAVPVSLLVNLGWRRKTSL